MGLPGKTPSVPSDRDYQCQRPYGDFGIFLLGWLFKVRFESDIIISSMTSQNLIHLTDMLQLPDKIFTHSGHQFNYVEVFALTCDCLTSA